MIRFSVLLLVSLLLGACSVPAVKYDATYKNVQIIKQDTPQPISIGEAKAKSSSVKQIGMRADTIVSPHGESMVDYISFALKSELEKAGIYHKDSDKKINLLVLENDIDEKGFSEGVTTISVEFSVTKKGKMLFQKTLMTRHTWESSFVAAIALPRALNSYPMAVSDLLQKLYSDKDFKAALAK